ncbi:MAG: TonB-dependent receptor [Putridiphycobacter sp.]|nr:TonB-dependent receptor [Putridiphycobacter sp.]
MKFLVTIVIISFFSVAQAQSGYTIQVVNEDSTAVPFPEAYIEEYKHSFYGDLNGLIQLPFSETKLNPIQISAEGYQSRMVQLDGNLNTYAVILTEAHRLLDKVIVSTEVGVQRESIANISRQSISDLSVIKSESLGEALANMSGVEVTGIGTGIAKPVIRGLSGASVVTYVNGLRIQNQQWGGDHGLPITSLGIGSAEVVKGPASLLYGPDAMGGVLYFRDEPFVKHNTQKTFLSTRFDANSLGSSTSAGYQVSFDKWHVNAYAGYDNHADYRLPNNTIVSNSRFNQLAGKLVLGYHHKNWLLKVNYDYYKGRIGLPGHTHEINPELTDFLTDRQNRGLNAPAQDIENHFISAESRWFFGKNNITLVVGNTNNQLNEHEEKVLTPDILINLNNSLYHIKWEYKINKHFNYVVGSQGMLQLNRNDQSATEILIPDANTTDLGGYFLFNANHKKWRFQAGGRYDSRSISVTPTADFPALERQYGGFSFSGGAARLSQKTTLRFNLSSGFRAPTTSELLSNGVHHGSNRFEIGNVDLLTENAFQIDFSAAWHLHDLELIVNPFYNRIQNYIYIQPSNQFLNDYRVFTYEQTDFAQLSGVDFGAHYHPHHYHWLHFETSFATILANDQQGNDLPLIPQTNIRSQVRIDFNMKSKISVDNLTIQYNHFFEQNRVGLYDISSSAYGLLNANVETKIKSQTPVFLSFGAKNILNTEYIPHLSSLKMLGIQQPGRNLYIALKIQFEKQIKQKP